VAFNRFRLIRFAAGLAALMLSDVPAGAQNFFDMLFGGSQRQQQNAPPQTTPNVDPNRQNGSDRYGEPSAPSSGGGRVAYCVRLCDGRYFPMQRNATADPVQLCSAFCPAANTQVFNGSQIDQAYAGNGARYASLDNAFVYRKKVVDGCTCNGRDSFGLARIDVASDPTLRPGDIVATGDNVKAALIATQAAKERARDTATDRSAPRGSPRTATAVPVPPAAKAPAEAPTPSEPTDDIPED